MWRRDDAVQRGEVEEKEAGYTRREGGEAVMMEGTEKNRYKKGKGMI